MPSRSDVDRPVALDEFMSALRDLRALAGDPSFRRMAAKSGAVSHATLHLTVTGRRLQPWETVREFVRACDGDEDAWHARWEETSRALAADPRDATRAAAGEVPAPPPRAWWRAPRVLAPAAAVLAVIVVAVVVAVRAGDGDHDSDGRAAAAQGQRSRPVVYPGDAARFVGDVTYPDGTRVKPDAQFVKVWEFRNSGTVEWRSRYLQRTDLPIGRDDCATPERIPINDTHPRQNVQVTVTVRTPPTAPVDCKVHWKMVDGSGHVLMPGYRPVFFAVRVRR